MLYPTHKRYGILFGFLMFPIAVTTGLLPIITKGMRFSDSVLVIILAVMGMLGATFGAEFPDCDSHASIPTMKYPLIHNIMMFFHVKHRGKFSHDYGSLAIFFGAILLLFTLIGKKLIEVVAKGGLPVLPLLATLLFVAVLANVLSSNFNYYISGQKRKVGLNIVTFTIIFAAVMAILFVSGYVTFNFSNRVTGLKSITLAYAALRTFIIFTWAGAYSHLFADMSTNEGVNILWHQVSPARMILSLRKIPILGLFVRAFLMNTEFKTGSHYEDVCRFVVTILCIPAAILAVVALSGGDVMQVLHNFNILK